MKNIIFLSPPAAGKGTQSNKISSKYNIPAISFGDLLREEASSGSELGNYIHELQTKGVLVDDDIALKVLEKRLNMDDCLNGYILDGYPRNINQAHAYDELLKKLNRDLGIVIFLNPPFDAIKNRVVGRVSCPNCKATFNEEIDFLKPKKQGICDNCGEALVRRSDDNLEAYKTRYDVYLTSTSPLIDFYKERNVLYEIDDVNIDTVTSKIIEIIEGNNN